MLWFLQTSLPRSRFWDIITLLFIPNPITSKLHEEYVGKRIGNRKFPPPRFSRGEGQGWGDMRRRSLTPMAQQLRNNPTEAEKYLWHILRGKRMGVKFRRQVVIGRYIVDFVCFEKKLVIEVDGGQHNQNQKDVQRDGWLKSQGFEVVRFWNNDVLGNLDGVFEILNERLNSPTPPPHPGPQRLPGGAYSAHVKNAGEGIQNSPGCLNTRVT